MLDAAILERTLPFGESTRSTKRTRYRIQDPALRFWLKLLQDHASTVFEDFCRQQFSDAARYWEGTLEFDLVRSELRNDAKQRLVVSEVKWKLLSVAERRRLETELEEKWQRSALRHRHANVAFEVLDPGILKQVRKETGSARRRSPAKTTERG